MTVTEHGVIINALNEMRNDLLEEERPTDIVDEVLLKAIDAPTKRRNDAMKRGIILLCFACSGFSPSCGWDF